MKFLQKQTFCSKHLFPHFKSCTTMIGIIYFSFLVCVFYVTLWKKQFPAHGHIICNGKIKIKELECSMSKNKQLHTSLAKVESSAKWYKCNLGSLQRQLWRKKNIDSRFIIGIFLLGVFCFCYQSSTQLLSKQRSLIQSDLQTVDLNQHDKYTF